MVQFGGRKAELFAVRAFGKKFNFAMRLASLDIRKVAASNKPEVKERKLTMKIRIRNLSVSVGLLLIGVFVGCLVGMWWQFEKGVRPAYTASWSGLIAHNVAVIGMLKDGDTERALEHLEMPLESSVLQLAYSFKQSGTDINIFRATIANYSGYEVFGLQVAKQYHAVSDSWKPAAEALAVLDAVPELPR